MVGMCDGCAHVEHMSTLGAIVAIGCRRMRHGPHGAATTLGVLAIVHVPNIGNDNIEAVWVIPALRVDAGGGSIR